MTELEIELLHAEIATLRQLLDVHEEQATKQFEIIRAQQKHLEEAYRLEVERRQAQKLESIGRLAAGVAHEINTPIQFVTNSIHFLKTATGELLALFDQLSATPLPEELLRVIDAADLPYLRANVAPAIESSLEGLRRVAAIVASLKQFAHPESSHTSLVDLNSAIETTLTITAAEYRQVADVRTAFGALPLVECHPGDINQVLLNLIVNASHAITDRFAETGKRGLIRIGTHRDGERVVIEIGDTGGGIPSAIRDRIYDPFFTTKEVGKGTGQGLAIARSVVVDKHHGELRFDTDVGVGTTFYIAIPLAYPRATDFGSR